MGKRKDRGQMDQERKWRVYRGEIMRTERGRRDV